MRPNSADVIDYFGDRQICGTCGATVSSYGDKCTAPLEVRCEGFNQYEDLLGMVIDHLITRKGDSA